MFKSNLWARVRARIPIAHSIGFHEHGGIGRTVPALAIASVTFLLLTWLLIHGINSDAEEFDRVLTTLDDVLREEGLIRSDVVASRTGFDGEYDPLAQDVGALEVHMMRLREVSVADPKVAHAVERLDELISQQSEQVGRLKAIESRARISMNSFVTVGVGLTPDPDRLIASKVGALELTLLQLVLNASPVGAREFQSRLDDLARGIRDPNAEPLQALLSDGRLLHDLIPAAGDLMKAVFTLPISPQIETIRLVVLQHQIDSRQKARRFRVLLYGISLVLLGTLLRFGVQLRTRAIALKRRAGLEYLIASLSMRFIPSQSEGVENDIVRALAELGRYIGADRAYVLFSDRSRRQYLWSQPGTPTAQDWPNRALVLSRDMPRTTYGGIHVRRVDFLPDGSVKNDLVAAGLASWACVVRHNVDGKADLLGFDALHPARTSWRNDLGLLRMAFEAIASAVGREQLEMDRNRLQEHLQRTRRLETIGALASGIAHNFNNIAGAIIGYTELIETETRPVERAARNLAAIRRAAERASDLVDQILAYGKRRTTPPQLVDLRTLFIEAADLVHASFPSAIGLVVRQAPDTVIVTGEPAQIQQVIINLCNNAAQAMPDGGSVQLTLETSNIDQGRALSHGALSVGRYARITVGDSGHGIDANVMEHLFEPFFTGRSGGNGLGLATVREIVDDHCGAIDVCTSPGKGTRIDVWLPCSKDILSWSSGPHDHDDMIFGRGEAVLLVHSDPGQLLKDEEMIAALGYEPVGFSNTVEALAACREDPARFHASIVSQCPTEREALDIAASLHAIDPLLPIVLALASSEEFLPTVLADVGVSEILRRPLTSSNTAVALKSIDRQ